MAAAPVMAPFEPDRVRRSIWAAANAMRAAGLSTLDAIEHLGFFLAERCSVAACPNDFRPAIEDTRTLARVHEAIDVLELDRAHVDVNGAVYEQLIATLGEAGHLGQYFTPRHIVDLMVAMVDPQPGESIYDPAAGTGGFLLRAQQRADRLALHGRELNAVVRRLCLWNFVIHGADPANLAAGDSLAKDCQAPGRHDVVLTNPPFGATVGAREDLADFAVASGAAELLFIQHVVASLADGGRAAVVCPEGLLANLGTERRLRRHLLGEARVEAVVSLPSGVFNPYTAVRTGIVLLRKAGPTRSVWFFDVRRDGYELNAARRPDGDSDLPLVRAGLATRADGPQSALVGRDELERSDLRLVAARFVRGRARGASRHALVALGDLVRVRREQVEPSASPDGAFLCVGLEHVEANTGRVELPAPVPGSTIRSAKNRFLRGDVLYGKLRPYLAKVVLAPCDGICTTELVVLEPDASRVDPSLLAALLRSREVADQATRLMTGANHPRIGLGDLLELRLPVPPLEQQGSLVGQLGALEDEIAASTARVADLRDGIAAAVGELWDQGASPST